MALPLPKVVPDVGPGGRTWDVYKDIVGGNNALTKGSIEAMYAPIIAQAEAASKLAYANLMGPQFLAKLLGNEDILGNLTPEEFKNAKRIVYGAGSGQGTGNALVNPSLPSREPSLIGKAVNAVRDAFGFGQAPTNNLVQQQNIPEQNRNALINNPTTQNYVPQQTTEQPGYAYDKNGNNIVGTQEDINNAINRNNNQKTPAENAGEYAGTKAELKESGTIRAKNIDELNTIVFNGQTNQSTLDGLSEILSSPEFEQIRQVPLAGHHELSYYSKFGTPAQQNMVGKYYTLTGNIIKDSARDFPGAFRTGEQQLLNTMKANPSDTVDVARGKVESLSTINKLLTERSRLTSHLMKKYHWNKLEASEEADKQLNGDLIREQIHNKLNPKPTDEDIDYMAKKYGKSREEIKKQLKAKGIL